MQYTVNRGEKGKIEVKVDVPQTAFDETYAQVVGEFKKEVEIAGFRKGMVPEDMVEGKVGYNKILNEAASFLISKHLSEILKKEDLVPLSNPKIAVGSLAKGSPFSFTASLTLKPVIKIGDWKKIEVAKIKAKNITEEDVFNSIKNIFEAYKKQETKGTEEPKEPGEAKNVIYDAKGNVIPLTDEGKNKVDTNKIDDEFAKKIGARDLAHLQELVKHDLETIVAGEVEGKFEQEVFDELEKLIGVEVPDVLVDDELNRILLRLNSQLDQQGKTLEEFLTSEKTNIEDLKTKWRLQAEKNVKISLAMDEIGKEEKVQVLPEELQSALSGVDHSSFSAEQKRDLENYLVFSIFQAKTLDLVKKTIVGETSPKTDIPKEKPAKE